MLFLISFALGTQPRDSLTQTTHTRDIMGRKVGIENNTDIENNTRKFKNVKNRHYNCCYCPSLVFLPTILIFTAHQQFILEEFHGPEF